MVAINGLCGNSWLCDDKRLKKMHEVKKNRMVECKTLICWLQLSPLSFVVIFSFKFILQTMLKDVKTCG